MMMKKRTKRREKTNARKLVKMRARTRQGKDKGEKKDQDKG